MAWRVTSEGAVFDKTVPAGHWIGYATGVALLVWGARMLALAF